jgi:tetratricopeptide (TPR) repeat protein/DNA-binding CsgD family transcriptional regulator
MQPTVRLQIKKAAYGKQHITINMQQKIGCHAMGHHTFILPHKIYYKSLKTINGINFTHREIDVITYVLSGRSAKSIASLLFISPKTVETHIRNIMIKLEVNSKESIITFIENSDKFSILKKYYTSLLTQTFFETQLKKIGERISAPIPSCSIVYWRDDERENGYVQSIDRHLKLVEIKVFLDPREEYGLLLAPSNDSSDYLLYCLPEKLFNTVNEEKNKELVEFCQSIQEMTENPSRLVFLLSTKEPVLHIQEKLGSIEYINFSEQENYYLLFLKLLQKIIQNLEIDDVIAEFEKHCRSAYNLVESPTPVMPVKDTDILRIPYNLLRTKKSYALVALFFMGVGGVGFLSFCWKYAQSHFQGPDYNDKKLGQLSIRSDLILPAEKTLLTRSELLSQIDKGFKPQQTIQSVALTGIGGSGKTTLARQYAHKQKANVIWEISAETKESLRQSFESLAYALTKTEDDKKSLREIRDFTNIKEKEERVIQFVRERLKLIPQWFLIYDNVESFSTIQKFFPQDVETWGVGKILLTTRDDHIQTNSYINHVICVGELNPTQSLSLYLKIIEGGEYQRLIGRQQAVKEFLERIPPFPLDISIAAYYMKTSNIAYEQYLERLNEQNKDFSAVQERLLKETLDYTRSRYKLITLSLRNIIQVHQDFVDLLLLISLLDPQNIPREILDHFKSKEIVDSFIYNLKRYSLISNNLSPSPLGPTFSMHRSTQAISLAYLKKHLNLESNQVLIENIAHSVGKYANHVIESEDFLRTKSLVSQLEAVVNHQSLINDRTTASLKGELGCIYCKIKDFKQAKLLLEGVLSTLSRNHPNHPKIAQISLYLGNTYQELGDYEKAKDTLNKALVLYQKLAPEDRYAGEARTLSFLGSIYRYFGNYKKAANLLEQSYDIYKKHISETHAGALFALSHLGVLQGALGNNEKAKSLLEKSFLGYKKQFSENSVRAAWVLAHLGSIYRNLGEYEKAKSLLEKTLTIYKAHFPEHNLVIGWVLTHLGAVHLELGNYREAKILLEKSLTIHQKHLNKDHLKIAWTSLNLGRVYVKLSQFQEGQALLEKSLKACEAQKEKNHMEIARILHALGELYLAKNQMEAAEKYFLKSLETFLVHKHPDRYMVFESLGELNVKRSIQAMHNNNKFYSHKFKKRAVEHLQQALGVAKTSFPITSPHKARIESKLRKLGQE